MTQENKVKLVGTVMWSEAKTIKTADDSELLLHRYLVRNTREANNGKEIGATFTIESWQTKEVQPLFVKGDEVVVMGALAINYRPAVITTGKGKGSPIMETAKDGKQYQKTYTDVIIRATSVQSNLPF